MRRFAFPLLVCVFVFGQFSTLAMAETITDLRRPLELRCVATGGLTFSLSADETHLTIQMHTLTGDIPFKVRTEVKVQMSKSSPKGLFFPLSFLLSFQSESIREMA